MLDIYIAVVMFMKFELVLKARFDFHAVVGMEPLGCHRYYNDDPASMLRDTCFDLKKVSRSC